MRFRPLFQATVLWFGHSLIAIVAIPIVTTSAWYFTNELIGAISFNRIALPSTLLVLPFFPLQITASFSVGSLLYRWGGAFGRTRAAQLSWLMPLLWFLFMVSGTFFFDHKNIYEVFFSSNAASRRLQVFTTLPLLTTLSYSVGNLTAQRWRR